MNYNAITKHKILFNLIYRKYSMRCYYCYRYIVIFWYFKGNKYEKVSTLAIVNIGFKIIYAGIISK